MASTYTTRDEAVESQKCRTCGEDVAITRDESGGVEQTDGSGDVICDDCWDGRVA